MKRTQLGLITPGTKFRLEVALKDENGLHVGYGPGETVWTKQEPETRWFAVQPVYVEVEPTLTQKIRAEINGFFVKKAVKSRNVYEIRTEFGLWGSCPENVELEKETDR